MKSLLPFLPDAMLGIVTASTLWIVLAVISMAHYLMLWRSMERNRAAAHRPEDADLRQIADDGRDVLRLFLLGVSLFGLAGVLSLTSRLVGGFDLPPPFTTTMMIVPLLVGGQLLNTLAVRLWAVRQQRRIDQGRRR